MRYYLTEISGKAQGMQPPSIVRRKQILRFVRPSVRLASLVLLGAAAARVASVGGDDFPTRAPPLTCLLPPIRTEQKELHPIDKGK